MAFVVVKPEMLATAATQLDGSASALSAAHAAAEAAITRVVAAAGDDVSAAIASVFSEYGQTCQALSVQIAGFHAQFAQATKFAADAYEAAELEFYTLLATRQASRTAMPYPPSHPHTNETSPAGGG